MFKMGIAAFFGLLLMTTSYAETRIGGMTAREAFLDARVARMVDAASDNDFAEVDTQIRSGADVNYIGTDEISPLLWVIITRNWKATEYLLKAGANPNYRDSKRQGSAMYLAAGGDSPKLLELLLKYKGDPNLMRDNESLLDIAVTQDRRENINLLLNHGADLNLPVRNGETVANTAARLGKFDLVKDFLDKGLTYNLQGLAKSVEARHVRPGGEQQPWKDKVIEMLKARGAKFPAFDPKNPQGT